MKCDEIKTLLSPYADNELAQAETKSVRTHLSECSACAKEVASLQKIKNMLHTLPSLTAPTRLLEGVRNNLVRHNPEAIQRSNTFLRYRWLTLSLASAAAVILVAFTVMIQFRESDIPSPEPASRLVDRYAEKTKANLNASALAKTNVANAIQTQPMLFTQQINISALDVDNTVAKIYAAASAQTPDIRLKAEYQKKQAAQEELLAKAPTEKMIQHENPIMSNSAAPLRGQKIQSQKQLSQVVKISIPLSQKEAFIKQLRGDVSDKLVLAEMQATSPIEQRNRLSAGYLADAGKALTENELADKDTNTYDATGKNDQIGLVAKKSESNKIEGATSDKAKGEESKDGSIVTTGSVKESKESPKDEAATKPQASPETTPPTPPAVPAPSAPPPPPPSGGFGKILTDKKDHQDNGTKDRASAEDTKNTSSRPSQVQPEPMIEFIIVIDPSGK